ATTFQVLNRPWTGQHHAYTSVVSACSTRFRPFLFALNRAWSAELIRLFHPTACDASLATTPKLPVIEILTPFTSIGSRLRLVITRFATIAVDLLSLPGSTIKNSSPPYRPIESYGRITAAIR